MTELKLGRLPKAGMVRMHVAVPETLKDELDRYAAEYSRLYEPADVATLIPHMLEAFIRSDRGYRRRRTRARRGESPERSAPFPGASPAPPGPEPDPEASA